MLLSGDICSCKGKNLLNFRKVRANYGNELLEMIEACCLISFLYLKSQVTGMCGKGAKTGLELLLPRAYLSASNKRQTVQFTHTVTSTILFPKLS